MTTRTFKAESWDQFEKLMVNYFKLDSSRRAQYVFRGHSKSSWSLEPTIDRITTHKNGLERDQSLWTLITAFERNSLGLGFSLGQPTNPKQWELLGRHHGLPTSILDWTRSVYVALFFAAVGVNPEQEENIAIWIFDREYFLKTGTEIEEKDDFVEIYDEIDDFKFNIRAIEQQAIYMKIHYSTKSLQEILGEHLQKVEISRECVSEIITRVSEMRINHRLLFRDLDAAAKTATHSVFERLQ